MIPLLCPALTFLPGPTDPDAPTCLVLDLDLAGQIGQTWPDDGISTLLSLPRSRAELGIASGAAQARIAVTGTRSGGLSSTTGISGEAIVPRVQLAEAAWSRPNLRIAAGLIDDPWVASGNLDWGLRAVAPVLGEAAGWMDRSDLGLSAGWRPPGDLATVILTATSGEGADTAERNNGKTTTGFLRIAPLRQTPDRLSISLMGRDGSRGLDSARDHRAGLRITSTLPPVRLGIEGLAAWGVGGDIERTPAGLSAWSEVTLPRALSVFARLDQTREAPDTDSATWTLRGGLTAGGGPARLVLGAEHTAAQEQAMLIAGADALAATTTIYALLNVRMIGAVEVAAP